MKRAELMRLLPDGNEGKPELNYKLRTLFEYLLKKVEMIELMGQEDPDSAKHIQADPEPDPAGEAGGVPAPLKGEEIPEEKNGGKSWGDVWKNPKKK